MDNLLIGVNSRIGGGKDTFADFAVQHYGYKKLFFADPLKNEVKDFLLKYNIPFEDRNIWGTQADKEEILYIEDVSEIFDDFPEFLDIKNKTNYFDDSIRTTYRYLLQWWGTDYRRVMCSDSYWVDKFLIEAKKYNKVIVSDMRFPNEYDAIVSNNGLTIKIIRPNSFESNTALHISETALDHITDWWHVIINSGTLEDYLQTCDNILTEIEKRITLYDINEVNNV